jgi:SAM domain (Sterile alpha motif)
MEVAGWLRGLGLERYEQAFRENAIDAEVLAALTDADLEKLGVLLGHRKRLLKAIAELRKDVATTASLPEVPVEPGVRAAERRQLSVLFCDLVGSTAPSAPAISSIAIIGIRVTPRHPCSTIASSGGTAWGPARGAISSAGGTGASPSR